MNRREMLQGMGAAAALSLSKAGLASAPVGANDKLTVGCIGVGSQGLRVLLDMLRMPEVQVIAVCSRILSP